MGFRGIGRFLLVLFQVRQHLNFSIHCLSSMAQSQVCDRLLWQEKGRGSNLIELRVIALAFGGHVAENQYLTIIISFGCVSNWITRLNP